MKFSLVILTLNEIEGCKIIIPRINKKLFDEIIVIDGGSTDGTIDFLKSHNLKVIHQNKKYTKGVTMAKAPDTIAVTARNSFFDRQR